MPTIVGGNSPHKRISFFYARAYACIASWVRTLEPIPFIDSAINIVAMRDSLFTLSFDSRY